MSKKIIYLDDAIDALEKSRFPGAPYIDTGILIALREIKALPSAQPEILACGEGELIVQPDIIRCKDCMHNGSYDTDCPIDWNGKEYCSFAERITDE